ncbi:MAG: hypothetical protein LC667_02860 [Thioalkalivibrio sp.]|nr:hypothetical protein [Thioalkalivibrio sp.]
MARVELAPEVGADLEQILEHLARHEVADAPTRIREIIEGISVLEHHPAGPDQALGVVVDEARFASSTRKSGTEAFRSSLPLACHRLG